MKWLTIFLIIILCVAGFIYLNGDWSQYSFERTVKNEFSISSEKVTKRRGFFSFEIPQKGISHKLENIVNGVETFKLGRHVFYNSSLNNEPPSYNTNKTKDIIILVIEDDDKSMLMVFGWY